TLVGPGKPGEILQTLVAVLDDDQPVRIAFADRLHEGGLGRDELRAVGGAHRLVHQVEGGDGAAPLVALGNGRPQRTRPLLQFGVGPESVAVLLAAVVGGALSAGYAVQVEDTVQPRLFGPIDRLVEPGPAVVTVFARLVVVFQQAVPEGDAHVIEA